ncbi:MAG: GerMN domain-containing protein [Actinomycetota bacterium]
MRRAAALLAVALALAGCGSAEDGVRDEGLVAAGDRAVVSPATGAEEVDAGSVAPQPAPGVAIVYFLRYDEPVPTRRSVPVGETVAESGLAALLAGPSAAERSLRYSSAIPDGTRLVAYAQEGRTAIVDLSALPDPQADGGQEALLALYQVVYTVTAGGGIDAVKVRVDGRPYGLGSLTGDTDALEPPLTRADLSFVVGAEAQLGSTGCAVAKEDAEPYAGEPALELARPQDGAVVEETLQIRGRLLSDGGPIVIRLLQDGLEVSNRIIDERCRGAFSATVPVPRTLAGAVELVVSTPETETAPALEARRVVEIAGA